MIDLPIEFETKMKKYLGEEYGDFIACYDKPQDKGIRVNTLKCTAEKISQQINIKKSPYSPLSFYVEEQIKIGLHPYHAAGAFYSQEPSASSAVTILDPHPGDKVLDMCAAPGGKSTQIAALLGGKGLLWSNEVVKSRANILVSNIERMGIKNAVVSSAYPDVLEKGLKGFFDKVLVDAPCSGEGMFRKNHEAVAEWSPEHVEACAIRQLAILNSAAECVCENGVIVYSTCTFSYEENEGVVKEFLDKHEDFILVPIDVNFGRSSFDIPALRIFPMDGGEGHFVAKLKRLSPNKPKTSQISVPKIDISAASELYKSIFNDEIFGQIIAVKDKLLILPKDLPEIKGLGVIRGGVILGEVMGKRIEPHHSLFTCQHTNNCKNILRLSVDNCGAYLHGEEVECDCKGYTAVAIDDMVVGFGKASGGRLKNKYPKGLRTL